MPQKRLSPAAGGTAREARKVAGQAPSEDNGTPKKIKRKREPRSRQERWAQRNPSKRWAHSATRSAVYHGLLTKPDICECCGEPGPVEAHHPDYRNPLRVVWLRRSCHKALHAAMKREGAR